MCQNISFLTSFQTQNRLKLALQVSKLASSPSSIVAIVAIVAAKDQLHATAVEESGGEFYPIVVESFGGWAPFSLITLREIASRATTYTGLPRHRALTNLMQQLFVFLWRYNARVLRSQLDLSDDHDVSGWDLAG